MNEHHTENARHVQDLLKYLYLLKIQRKGNYKNYRQKKCLLCSTAPAASLWNTIISCLKNSKSALVTHLYKDTECELQHHIALVRHKVTYILQHEESWSVIITEGEVGSNQRILK